MIEKLKSLYYDKINKHIVIAEFMDDSDKLYNRKRFIPLGIVLYCTEDNHAVVLSPYFIKISVDMSVVENKKLKDFVYNQRHIYLQADLLKHIENINDIDNLGSDAELISRVAADADILNRKLKEMSDYSALQLQDDILLDQFISYIENNKISFVYGGFGSFVNAKNDSIEKYQQEKSKLPRC